MGRISLIRLISSIRLIAVAATAATALLCVPPAHASVRLSSPPNNMGLVGLWNFNAGAGTSVADSSGSGNTGTLTNGPSWVNGKFSKGLSFDGSDDYVNVPDTGPLDYPANFTLSTWFYSTVSSTSQILLNKGDGGFSCGASNFLLYLASNNKLRLCFSNTPVTEVYSAGTISQNRWYHVAATADGTTLAIYVDGTLSATSTQGAATTNNGTMYISYPGVGQAWNGTIDDVRIYNRALSATEVRTLYNSTGVGKVNSSRNNTASNLQNGLVLWHTFDGNKLNSTTSTDSSTYGNNGSLVGSPARGIGKTGQAINFPGDGDGAGDYVNVPQTTNLDGQSALTIALWFKQTGNDGSGYNPIINSNVGVEYPAYNVTFEGSGPLVNISLYMKDVIGTQILKTVYGRSVAGNQWHFLVLKYDGEDVTLSVDGISHITASELSGPLVDESSAIQIGARSTYGWYFRGSMDDVRVYNRALSAGEILQLYNATGGGNRVNTTLNNPVSNLQSGLVGWWPFDGKYLTTTTATDLGSGAHNGTLTNGPVSTIGKVGQALSFDGSNDFVTAATSSVNLTGPMTVAAWARTPVPGTTLQTIVSKGNCAGSASTISFYLCMQFANGVSFVVSNGSATATINAGSVVQSNTWYHAVGTFDGTYINLYINGALAGGPTATGFATLQEKELLTIGASVSGNQRFFNGSIDDVRIYNRVLSASEVLQLYNMGR